MNDENKDVKGNVFAYEQVENAMRIAKAHEVESEVMTSALMELKNDPNISIGTALMMGLEEWTK